MKQAGGAAVKQRISHVTGWGRRFGDRARPGQSSVLFPALGWLVAIGALALGAVLVTFPVRVAEREVPVHVTSPVRVVAPIPYRFGAGDLLQLTQHLPVHATRTRRDPKTGAYRVCVTSYNGDPQGGKPRVTASIETCYPDATPPKPMGRPEMP
jgi:hypothetical protein